MKTQTQTRTNSNSNSNYKKIKLSPESITVIKKALIQYITSELEPERKAILSQLSNDDYFLILYTYKKREHHTSKVKVIKETKETKDSKQPTLPTMEA